MKKIILACDYRGIALKQQIYKYAKNKNLDVIDIGIEEGSPIDYIDITTSLLHTMRKENAFGVIICGNGAGVAMVANRHYDMRAAVCRTIDDAESSRRKLNANILCLGSKQTSFQSAIEILHKFIDTPFQGGKHEQCANKLSIKPSNHLQENINVIVRGIILCQNHILLTKSTQNNLLFPQDVYFLPGGHVDYQESAITCLKRELIEEANFHLDKISFVGALETIWQRNDYMYHELNLVYLNHSTWEDINLPPISTEAFIEFVWFPIEQLPKINFLPPKMKSLVIDVCENKHTNQALFYSEI